MSNIQIVKNNGEEETFEPEKLRYSLSKAGAKPENTEIIIGEIQESLHDGDTTSEIYTHAFDRLKEMERPSAARYSMRRALAGLGPSGFPFERFVSEVVGTDGFATETGMMMVGACVEHEVDVVARRGEETVLYEVKFHNNHKLKTNVKTALYVKSRFDDLRATHKKNGGSAQDFKGVLLTNTKFTTNAIKYAECTGLPLISWSYPREGNLRDRINESGLHPVTALTTLNDHDKKLLIEKSAVLCRDIKNNPDILDGLGKKSHEVDEILAEANSLCVPTQL